MGIQEFVNKKLIRLVSFPAPEQIIFKLFLSICEAFKTPVFCIF